MGNQDEIRETCYRIGHNAAVKHMGRYVEAVVRARSLMFVKPDDYLQGYCDAMGREGLHFPKDMTHTTTGDVVVDMLAG